MNEEVKPKRRISPLRHGIGAVVLAALGLVFAAFAFGRLGNYEVISESMAPTLLKGDRVLVDQSPHYVPRVGDVVVFEDPEPSGELLTKRIAAIGGQSIKIAGGYLYVDGKEWAPLGEPVRILGADVDYVRDPLGEDEVYVLGDNVGNSEDSLSFGPVPAKLIKGRLLFVYWPLRRMGRVH